MKFSAHSHHTVIENEMVIFDEIGDKYWILNKEETVAVLEALHNDTKPKLDQSPLEDLLSTGILVKGTQSKEINFSTPSIKGVDLHEWQSSFKIGIVPVRKSIIIQSAVALTSICLLLRTAGLHKTLNLLRLIKKRPTNPDSLDEDSVLEISAGIKRASIYTISNLLPPACVSSPPALTPQER